MILPPAAMGKKAARTGFWRAWYCVSALLIHWSLCFSRKVGTLQFSTRKGAPPLPWAERLVLPRKNGQSELLTETVAMLTLSSSFFSSSRARLLSPILRPPGLDLARRSQVFWASRSHIWSEVLLS